MLLFFQYRNGLSKCNQTYKHYNMCGLLVTLSTVQLGGLRRTFCHTQLIMVDPLLVMLTSINTYRVVDGDQSAFVDLAQFAKMHGSKIRLTSPVVVKQ
jgi:hypothetical protein